MPYITMSEAVSSVRKGKKLSDSSAWRDTVDEDYKKEKINKLIRSKPFFGFF